MATVKIGDRDLEVRPATLGFLRHKLVPARKALSAAQTDEAIVDAMANLVFVYVGHNDGITLEWIFDHAPANTADLLRECLVASGQKVASKGEAARP